MKDLAVVLMLVTVVLLVGLVVLSHVACHVVAVAAAAVLIIIEAAKLVGYLGDVEGRKEICVLNSRKQIFHRGCLSRWGQGGRHVPLALRSVAVLLLLVVLMLLLLV